MAGRRGMACDTDASIRMDAGQLEQVLFNLVLNSRDAMSDGGEIEIRTEETAGEDGHATVGLVVSDTGTGMDADTLARCREPFDDARLPQAPGARHEDREPAGVADAAHPQRLQRHPSRAAAADGRHG